jgi:hypothetical protein
MTAILIFFLSMATVIFVVLICAHYFTDYKGSIDQHGPKLKFKTFCTFYEVNPDRWRLYEHYVACRMTRDSGRIVYSRTIEDFHFSYIDTWRYYFWQKNIQKRQDSQRKDKITASMLSLVKQDIADFESKSKNEVNKALETIRSIT